MTQADSGFTHDAMDYRDADGFLDGLVPFVHDGLANDEFVFALLPDERMTLLRSALGADADRVRFLDVVAVGANPARIIPTVRALLDENPTRRPARGIGEPVSPGLTEAALAEALLHEALVNIAFEKDADLWLRCPYDSSTLSSAVLESAAGSHPVWVDGDSATPSTTFDGPGNANAGFTAALTEPPATAVTDLVHFGMGELPDIRDLVTIRAGAFGMTRDRALDLTLATNEIATNSLCHGGERGTVRLWRADGAMVCEVSDAGHIDDVLIGRTVPAAAVPGGRGVWLANQVCDLVQIRSGPERGTVVRLHMNKTV